MSNGTHDQDIDTFQNVRGSQAAENPSRAKTRHQSKDGQDIEERELPPEFDDGDTQNGDLLSREEAAHQHQLSRIQKGASIQSPEGFLGSQHNFPFYTDDIRFHPSLSVYQPTAGGPAGLTGQKSQHSSQ